MRAAPASHGAPAWRSRRLPWGGNRPRAKRQRHPTLPWAARFVRSCRWTASPGLSHSRRVVCCRGTATWLVRARERSDEDEGVPRLKFPAPESRVGGCIDDGEVGGNERRGSPQGDPIRTRVCENHEQAIDLGVRPLPDDLAHLTLRVHEARLEFGAAYAALDVGDRQVPGPLIPSVADRHFTANRPGRSDQLRERLSEAKMRQVAQRFTAWIPAEPEIDADYARDTVQRRDIHPRRQTTLDTAELRRRDPGCVRHLVERQAGGRPRDPKLGPDVRSSVEERRSAREMRDSGIGPWSSRAITRHSTRPPPRFRHVLRRPPIDFRAMPDQTATDRLPPHA